MTSTPSPRTPTRCSWVLTSPPTTPDSPAPFTSTAASHGTVAHTLGGHDFTYTPDPGFHGDDTFTYTFTGTDNVERTATVTIHVTPTPSAAANDEYTAVQDAGPTLLTPDVTDNDTGFTGDFTFSDPDDGTVTRTGTGHDFTYTPDPGFHGDDTFTYTFTGTDNVERTATVTIHVTPTPSAAANDEYTVAQDSDPHS